MYLWQPSHLVECVTGCLLGSTARPPSTAPCCSGTVRGCCTSRRSGQASACKGRLEQILGWQAS
jgi:hypothetical protein